MSDIRASFPTLEDENEVGTPLSKSLEGDAKASKVGSTAFAFVDADDKLVLPKLDAEGKLPVTFDSAGSIYRHRETNAAGSLSLVTLSSITLAASKTYISINALVSCRRGAYFQLIQSDNAVETVIADMIVDAGQYTFQYTPTVDQIVAGGTGAQKLLIKGQNFQNPLSALSSSLSCKEVS